MSRFKHFQYDKLDPHNWLMTWREWAAVFGAALGAFLATLDIQITNASLREIQGSLGLDFSEGGWISTSYLIAEICVIPLTSYLSEVFGMRRYILVNTGLFIFASILCGCAWNLQSMIVFRIFQGFVGGTLIPMAFQVMLIFMPKDKRPIGMAIFGITATLAPTLGPSLGGWLTDTYSWRANFFINIVPGLLMMAAIKFGIPDEGINFSKLKRIDLSGILTLIVGLGSLTYILEDGAKVQWFEDSHIQIAFLISLAALSLFTVIQYIKKEPLLNLKILTERNFCLTAIITMVTGASLYGGIYALSMYLGQIQNYSATEIGKVMMWVGIPQLLIMPFLPFLMKRFDLRVLTLVGMALFAFSNFMNSGLDFNFAGEQFRLSLIVRAIGQPLFLIPLSTIAMAQIPTDQSGNASSIFNMLRNLGGSIGIAISGTFVVSRQLQHFYQYMESLTPFSYKLNELLYSAEMYFRQQGFDIPTAKMQAMKGALSVAVRDSYIQSFSDIFTLLSIALTICLFLVMLMRKVDMKDLPTFSEH